MLRTPGRRTDLAWLAGIIDGEGSLHIKEHKRDSGVYYYGQIAVGMCHEPTISRIQELCGGSIHEKPGKQENHSLCYVWNAATTQEKRFLRSLLPYVVTKREHVQCLLRLAQNPASGRECFEQMRVLNERGQ